MRLNRRRSLMLVLAASLLHVLPVTAQTAPALNKDEQAALTLAEKLYPSLLVQGTELRSFSGYVYRFYAGSGVYVGFRDSRIYLMGGPLGNAIQNYGSAISVLGSLRNAEARKQSQVPKEPVPQLQNVGLESFDSVDYSFNAVFSFKDSGHKGFYIFGDELPGDGPIKRKNPTFEFASLKDNTRIVAAIDGVVAFIKEQPESNDFEVFLQPKEGSSWVLGYDHVVNVAVTRGATVKAGDFLGNPGRQQNGLLRFELQINQDVTTNGSVVTTHFCPTFLLAQAVRDKVLADMTTTMDTWEKNFNLELYDPSRHALVGCIKPTLTTDESEGRI